MCEMFVELVTISLIIDVHYMRYIMFVRDLSRKIRALKIFIIIYSPW